MIIPNYHGGPMSHYDTGPLSHCTAIADFIHHISNGLTFAPKEVRNDKIMFPKDNQLLGIDIKQSDP